MSNEQRSWAGGRGRSPWDNVNSMVPLVPLEEKAEFFEHDQVPTIGELESALTISSQSVLLQHTHCNARIPRWKESSAENGIEHAAGNAMVPDAGNGFITIHLRA